MTWRSPRPEVGANLFLPRIISARWIMAGVLGCGGPAFSASSDEFPALRPFLDQHCAKCHDDIEQKGGLDLSELSTDVSQQVIFDQWVKIHDRVSAGEMPPKKEPPPSAGDREMFTTALAEVLTTADRTRVAREGRATQRRLNRQEYENTLRDLLSLPNLAVKDFLPADGEAHHFNKVSEALGVSHVQLAGYLAAAEFALRQAIMPQRTKPEMQTVRYYARAQPAFLRPMKLNPRIRRPFPVLGTQAQPEVLAGRAPWTVGAADPARREKEAVGVIVSTYEATEIRFSEFHAPVAGRYRLRFHAYPIWVDFVSDPTGAVPDYRGIDFTHISPGRRAEPVSIYADARPALRKLGSFDVAPQSADHELVAWLERGETIRPDAARLFRARGPDFRNPLQEPDGMPGVAFGWMEVEGPLIEQWPPAGHRLLFGDLPTADPSANSGATPVEIVSSAPQEDARRLLHEFLRRAYRRPVAPEEENRFLAVIQQRLDAGDGFTGAMLAGYTAVLCSPGFLYLEESPGWLDDPALAARLAYFLWNGPPDEELRAAAERGELHRPEVLRAQTTRLMDDPRLRRFVDAFLDYWIELRKISATSPDATLYPDYQLDDWLIESMVEEPRLFFAELVRGNLSAKNLVASDFAILDGRLAQHYGVPGVEGTGWRRVPLAAGSVRGGLLTQAAVLKVTANGTTTSPVVRGAWIMDRILGMPPSPPPAGVPALEPDTRGATTIREQLERHRADKTCAACHRQIDPAGFALENFDPMGGWRNYYRSLGTGERVPGVGHNAQNFQFTRGPAVDPSGELPDGRRFRDVLELKQALLRDPEPLARNLAQQLIIFATGAPITFADRPVVADILARAKIDDYGVRTLIHEIVQSDLFQTK